MFGGITTAASTSPDLTLSIACARDETRHRLNLAEELLRRSWLTLDALAAHLHRLAGRRLVDDRDARARRAARDREADQQRDRDRVDDQQRDQQPRAAQDQEVLARAADPHARRLAVASGRSLAARQERHERALEVAALGLAAGVTSSSAGGPSNSSRPSASTSSAGRRSAAPRRRCGWRTRPWCPRAARPAMNSHRRSRWAGSSEAEGSSSASTGGSAIRPSGDVDALAVAAGEAPDALVGARAQPRLLEHPLDRGGGVGDLLQAREQLAGSRRPRAWSRAPAAAAPSRPRRARG